MRKMPKFITNMPPAMMYILANRSRSSPSLRFCLRERQHQRAVDDREDPEREHRVRRAHDLHVEPVGVVPPVVEGRRRDHREASPDAEPGAERTAKAPDAYAGRDVALVRRDGALEHDEPRRQSGDQARRSESAGAPASRTCRGQWSCATRCPSTRRPSRIRRRRRRHTRARRGPLRRRTPLEVPPELHSARSRSTS